MAVPSVEDVRAAGKRSFYLGIPYSQNPYDPNLQALLHLAWSWGHNDAHAQSSAARSHPQPNRE